MDGGQLQQTPNYNDITKEKERALKQVWTYLLHSWNVEVDGTKAFKEEEKEKRVDDNKKKSSSIFGRWSSSSTQLQKDDSDNSTAGKYCKGMVHPSMAELDSTHSENEFWNMLRVDHPDSMIYRFSRARKYDSSKATRMLAHTLKFREKHQLNALLNGGEYSAFKDGGKEPGLIKNLELQKAIIFGYDVQNRPYIIVRPRYHYSSDQTEAELEKFALLVIELSRLFMKLDSISILFDLTGFSLSNMDYAPVKFLITCFEAHYPECLGHLYIHKAPWLFNPVWNIIKNWLDPVVASKIVFTKNINELSKYINTEQLPRYLDGEKEFDFENYIAPDGSFDSKLNDLTTRDNVITKRKQIIEEYKLLTVQWIESENDESSKRFWQERITLGEKLYQNYSELDPYIRSRSTYDINGSLKV
ncbi:hypothetical protein KAFR_0A06070 [Kazachstania africana CBS 2517]|uniref:CRAL-TRIO domain-containing protein n=1 Tax=Kazachstania africana (strain ATCC 22294 / BCRC 22015 / CBS 2517 / CECT 1963 / NBRC 1671 / NRRL Y-8276) TaxID=1071382 RepID=H2ANU2_KAZAF|nr:hypothetical protein KAFR_0A06070 [Kazachstania africana CBS 2517]CCF56042.1 hypothetical protein KAFR_0A06070 [Kazachstania africana CBS 2517]